MSASTAPSTTKRCRRSRRFTPVIRQLCLQHHACGLGYKKISKATGIPISTIKYHVRKERGVGSQVIAPGSDDTQESDDAPVASADNGDSPAPGASTEAHDFERVQPFDLETSVTRVAMMYAMQSSLKKTVSVFARALQHDSPSASSIIRTADPQILVHALQSLLHDPRAERSRLAALGRIVHQRLYAARDFARSAISLCQEEPRYTDSSANSTAATAASVELTAHPPPLHSADTFVCQTKYCELLCAAQTKPNAMVLALAVVSHALTRSGDDIRYKALVRQRAHQLAAQLRGSIAAAEALLSRCATPASECERELPTCSCHRVRISELVDCTPSNCHI